MNDNPFPLQSNVVRLKPQIGGVVIPVVTLILFLFQGPLKNIDFRKVMDKSDWAMAIVLIVAVAAALFFVSELLFKRIYFNRFGIGVVRPGTGPVWYAFDELKDVRSSMAPRFKRRNDSGHSRLRLIFHSGSVQINGGLYDRTQMEELVGLLASRTPQKPLPAEDPRTSKKSNPMSRFMNFPGA